MISKKYINVIVSILMIISLCLSSLLVVLPKDVSVSVTKQPDYVSTIFDKNSVININIEMDETNWKNMLDTAINETFTSAKITVNGNTYYNVAIRPKGNSSLSQIYNDDSTDRYSFKLKFDEYVDGQTLDGLSSLVLNNTMSDTTYMKEYLSYDLLSTMGIPTPSYAFANITVNDEPWGLYLAVETIEEDFIQRNYGSLSGNLYKPESDSVAVGDGENRKENNADMNKNFGDFNPNTNSDTQSQSSEVQDSNNEVPVAPPTENSEDGENNGMMAPPDGTTEMSPPNGDMPQGNMEPKQNGMPTNTDESSIPTMQQPQENNNADEDTATKENSTPQNNSTTENMPQNNRNQGRMNMGGGMNSKNNGSDLVWDGDDISNYSDIFNNAIFKTTDEEDYKKILDMIENLDTLTDIEKYLDVDEVLKYFAVNTFLVNLDSYASNMDHNYYLYENDGVVSILPWDYNLSFGAFQGGSAANVINFPIDVPVTDSLESSPLIGKLLEVDEYKELYHDYLNEILDNYINNGTYESTINKVDTLISDYVKNDATAFYTYDEYEASLPHLINYGYDRAKSIRAQLEGTQSSTTAGNIETTVDLTALGQQGGGNSKGGIPNENGGNFSPGQMPSNSDNQENNTTNNANKTNNFPEANNEIDRELMMEAMEILQKSEDGTITDDIKTEILALGLTEENIEMLSSFPMAGNRNNDTSNKPNDTVEVNNNLAMGKNTENTSNNNTTYILYGASVGTLILSLILVHFFKKKRYVS